MSAILSVLPSFGLTPETWLASNLDAFFKSRVHVLTGCRLSGRAFGLHRS